MQIGIQPDILVCRGERALSAEIKRKIALFCNVDFELRDRKPGRPAHVYEVPLRFLDQGLDREVEPLRLETKDPDLTEWRG